VRSIIIHKIIKKYSLPFNGCLLFRENKKNCLIIITNNIVNNASLMIYTLILTRLFFRFLFFITRLNIFINIWWIQ
jgi:hypothetical protein